MRTPTLLAVLACCSCSCNDKQGQSTTPATTTAMQPVAPAQRVSGVPLPGAGSDGVGMDYLLYNPHTNAVWVPAGNTASVDVIDVATRKVSQISGFPTKDMERNGKVRHMGPSSAALGDGVVYVGNRGDQSVCAVDERTLARGACATLDSSPDGILYVPSTREVWVTTPRDKSIRILDGAKLAQTGKLEFAGSPEGFAVDMKRGRFYTNMEDRDETLAIDVKSHQTVATWKPGCGEDGPHGLRVDPDAGLLFVACTAKVETISLDHDGMIVGSVDTGEGVDDFDYAPTTHLVYAGASKAGTLTIATVDGTGALAAKEVVPTAQGVRNGVVDSAGDVWLSHSSAGEILEVAAGH